MWLYDSNFKRVVGGFHGVVNVRLRLNASYVNRLRNTPKVYDNLRSLIMGLGQKCLGTDT